MKKNKETQKKKEAIVRGKDIGVSKKHSMAICKFLKGKKIETGMKELDEVLEIKRAIPMTGEIPHRKGMASGRYPIKASKIFIKLLKNLEANANVKGLDAEKTRVFAKCDKAHRPTKPGRFTRRKFKRTHITLVAREIA